ncbi:MAG: hypothetical protein R3Y46_06760 [Opitutales bacterium]
MKLKLLLTILLLPAILFAQSEDNADRSYFADFAKVKAILGYQAQNATDKIYYELSAIEEEDSKPLYILSLTTRKAEQLIISENNKDIFLTYETEDKLLKKYREALIAGDKDTALSLMRSDIYGLLPLVEAKEDVFIIQEAILEYLDLLVSAEKVNELFAIFETLKVRNLREDYITLALHTSRLLAEKGDFERSVKVLNAIDLDINNQDFTPALLEILSLFRDSGKIAEVQRYYERLKFVEGSDFKLEAEMWSLYCDIKLGNVLTAKVLLERFAGVDKKLPEYSLYKFILGLVARDGSTPLSALEFFSEGIVYGKSVDDWMPELMYNTALSYFKAEKVDVSKQILEEMKKFYPDNVFLAQAEKDLK